MTQKTTTALLLTTIVGLALALPASARDQRKTFSIKSAFESEAAKGKIDSSIKFYFGDQKHTSPSRSLGVITTAKKTNSFNKSDTRACEWAFLSAVIAFQDRAKRDDADAIVNILSNNKHIEFSSEDEFECLVGNVVAGVALKGELVELSD